MNSPEEFDSKYRYVLVAARRARQLLSGARPVIETAASKPCRVAMEEIKAGKVKWTQTENERSAAEVANELLDKAMGAKPEE